MKSINIGQSRLFFEFHDQSGGRFETFETCLFEGGSKEPRQKRTGSSLWLWSADEQVSSRSEDNLPVKSGEKR